MRITSYKRTSRDICSSSRMALPDSTNNMKPKRRVRPCPPPSPISCTACSQNLLKESERMHPLLPHLCVLRPRRSPPVRATHTARARRRLHDRRPRRGRRQAQQRAQVSVTQIQPHLHRRPHPPRCHPRCNQPGLRQMPSQGNLLLSSLLACLRRRPCPQQYLQLQHRLPCEQTDGRHQ